MEDLFDVFGENDHTPERWKDWYRRYRHKTALEPHDVSLVEINADRIILEMEIGDHARQPYGLLHGGMSMLLAESAASIHSCWGIDLSRRVPVGIEISGSHLRPAREGAVRAVGRVLRRSHTLVHHEVEVRSVQPEKMLSVIRVTNLLKSV